MESKKISFGFKKTLTKAIKPVVQEEKKEYIECVEEKSIRVVGVEDIQEDIPIVIPAQPNTLRNAEKARQIAESIEKAIEDTGQEESPTVKTEAVVPENETLEQMAVRELLEEAKKEVKVEKSEFKLALPEDRIPDGAKESTLEDYEHIPVGEFGMAMLRGMGWDPSQEKSKYKQPDLRPKGLGLGADKVVKNNQKKSAKKENEELTITKNAYVKVVTGKYSNYYGQVVSLDEENGRVMVNMPMKKETASLSEFMVQPVTKSEYDRESKVINKDSYDAYKNNETSQRKYNDSPKVSSSRHDSPKENYSSKKSETHRSEKKDGDRNESDSDRRQKYRENDEKLSIVNREKRQDYSSSDEQGNRRLSSRSSSSPERRRKSKHKKKRDKSSNSESSDSNRKYKTKKQNGKRDIDKKRKGKKKKRDRDRSPNYKKHRK